MASMTSPGQRQDQAAANELAAYVAKAQAAILDGTIKPENLAVTCTECGVEATEVQDDDDAYHVLAQTPKGHIVVVLGCEGYWMVDPNVLGFDRPNWQNWTAEFPELRLVQPIGGTEEIVADDTERTVHLSVLGKHFTEIRELTDESMWMVGYDQHGTEVEITITGPMLTLIKQHLARD